MLGVGGQPDSLTPNTVDVERTSEIPQEDCQAEDDLFCFLDRAFSIMKTKINQQNAQINSGLIYY